MQLDPTGLSAAGVAALLCTAALAGNAHAGELDSDFGTGGMATASLLYPATLATARDNAVIACPGPLGSLIVVGSTWAANASDAELGIVWLTPQGTRDVRFGQQGSAITSVKIDPPRFTSMLGACAPDGTPYLAIPFATAQDVASKGGGPIADALVVVNIDPETGALGDFDPYVLDSARAGFAIDILGPLGLSVGASGRVFLTGAYVRDEIDAPRSEGFALGIDASGTAVSYFSHLHPQFATESLYEAQVGDDGLVWAVGQQAVTAQKGGDALRAAMLRLSVANFAPMALHLPDPQGTFYADGGGMLSSPTRGVLIGKDVAQQHRVLIFGATGAAQSVALPQLDPGEPTFARARVLALSPTRLLVAQRTSDASRHYFARLLRDTQQRWRPDRSFDGDGALRPAALLPTACPGDTAVNFLGGLSMWNGGAVSAGMIDNDCPGAVDAETSEDFLVMRLHADDVFGDGLEGD